MRAFRFKFRRGDIVRVADGLGFASPRPKEFKNEKAVVIGHSVCRRFFAQWNSVKIKSLNNPNIVYWVLESSLTKTTRK